ncbi:hypothetical protein U1Q18_021141 [Sarracenia purpurea var. burkii]
MSWVQSAQGESTTYTLPTPRIPSSRSWFQSSAWSQPPAFSQQHTPPQPHSWVGSIQVGLQVLRQLGTLHYNSRNRREALHGSKQIWEIENHLSTSNIGQVSIAAKEVSFQQKEKL